MKPKAIIDASFWIHLIKLELEEIFLQYYEIITTTRIEEEILYCNNFKYFIYKPKDIKLYENFKKENKIQIKNPKTISKELESQISKNSGELQAIALAKENNYIVFIDNGRPNEYCIKNNILSATIIDFLIFLNNNKILTKKEILYKINLIKNSLPKNYLKKIENYKYKYVK